MQRLPQRSKRFGVGKEIGGAFYVHRRYEDQLDQPVAETKAHLPPDFDYQIVKYSQRTGTVSFVQSDDFDTASEPTVGDILIVSPDGQLRPRRQPADPEIYHHKWLFVANDYEGFDVEASKQRSLKWLSLEDVDRSRIGKKSYWQQHVVPRLPDDS
jgi:hypothetical protein